MNRVEKNGEPHSKVISNASLKNWVANIHTDRQQDDLINIIMLRKLWRIQRRINRELGDPISLLLFFKTRKIKLQSTLTGTLRGQAYRILGRLNSKHTKLTLTSLELPPVKHDAAACPILLSFLLI